MGTYTIPDAPTKYSKVVDYFRGVDLNNSPSNVDPSRSPAAPNMIRDQVGKVRKRMGYHTVATAPNSGKINGTHRLEDKTLIHAGDKLYLWNGADGFTELSDMADEISRSFLFDGKLYLLDGGNYRVYDGTAVTAVEDAAHVPTVIISRTPTGGGTVYEALNMLSVKWTESFLGTASTTEYQLTDTDLDAAAVTAEVLGSDGNWAAKVESTDFTVNRTTGVVTFTTAPGASPVTGMDNVHITAAKTREGYREKIVDCRVCVIYGVGGAADRVFLSGNADFPGYDFFSGYNDPTYFPDTGYTRVSRDGSAVIGYAILNNSLATFLSGAQDGRNVLIRQGSLDDNGEPLFKITNTLIGENAVARSSFCFMGKEPVFLTDRGVYAITAEELTGEKYTQERSYYISSALREITDKQNAFSAVYREFYVLALGGDLYLLDGLQKTYEQNNPYSSFQYEAYFWPEIAARVLWTQDEALCFGTADGKLCAFYTNVDALTSYNDDGEAIDAYWETSDFDGKGFFRNKTFTGVSCRLAAAAYTGVKISAQVRGLWSLIFDAKEKARFLDWSYIDFAKFVFSADRTPRTLFGKIKIKKVDKARFRLQNSEKNEPFGLYAFGVEWKEPGSDYKR